MKKHITINTILIGLAIVIVIINAIIIFPNLAKNQIGTDSNRNSVNLGAILVPPVYSVSGSVLSYDGEMVTVSVPVYTNSRSEDAAIIQPVEDRTIHFSITEETSFTDETRLLALGNEQEIVSNMSSLSEGSMVTVITEKDLRFQNLNEELIATSIIKKRVTVNILGRVNAVSQDIVSLEGTANSLDQPQQDIREGTFRVLIDDQTKIESVSSSEDPSLQAKPESISIKRITPEKQVQVLAVKEEDSYRAMSIILIPEIDVEPQLSPQLSTEEANVGSQE
ncbi:MAG: hypothetical protein ACOCXQ_01650 [Patescibacteria group bacterium]